MTYNVKVISGSERPKLDYTTGKDGHLASEQYNLALDYLRKLQEQINEAGENSELVDIIGKELYAFAKTLPDPD